MPTPPRPEPDPATRPRQWVGTPYPLGATYDGSGTNFSIFSSAADGVELCLLDDDRSEVRIELTEVDGFIWHTYLPDIRPGQQYGYRVHGTWNPDQGLWSNPSKLLLDPYAKAIAGGVDWTAACFAYDFDDPDRPNTDDSARHVPLAVVSDPYFDWGNDRHPLTPMHDTVIYETHVRGFTIGHPGIPERLRGTYAGIAHPVTIEHLTKLGVTAIELMPVHQFIHDHHLHTKGLRNYWGYNTLAFLTPHNEYSSRDVMGTAQEFKTMVKALHGAGIEVILDVVYNHTAEGNDRGPMLSWRGIDNHAYYRLVDGSPRHYLDFTGTGNSLNVRHPHVLQLIMDSLRYWVLEMHVDGFRFDLASALARELYEVDRLSAFFDLVQQDPVVSQVKLIAEPWDVGEGGYQVGKFPPHWSEWNGQYRDTIRDFWRGEHATLAEFGSRITGSSDLYQADTRRPSASINFVTAHDGFTLADLVAYNDKHNDANGENGADGDSHNRSWNHGVEGPTEDLEIEELRRRQRRNFVTTLMLSQGVPMLLGGDEIGRTQHGNNNAYCQDNEISWYDWHDVDEDFRDWTTRVIAFRRAHPAFRRRRWFQGRKIRGIEDMAWFRPDGVEMSDEDWEMGFAQSVGVFVNGESIHTTDPFGGRILDDSFFLVFNASPLDIDWTLPDERWGARWIVDFDTDEPGIGTPEEPRVGIEAGGTLLVVNRSVMVLRRTAKMVRPTHPSARDTAHAPPTDRATDPPTGTVTAPATDAASATPTDTATAPRRRRTGDAPTGGPRERT